MRTLIGIWIFLSLAAEPAAPAENRKYRLSGRLLDEDGKPFLRVAPVAFLQGSLTPYSSQSQVGRDGRFKFDRLSPGIYTLVVFVPRIGEVQKTIEVGASFADSKGRVSTELRMERRQASREPHLITAAELSVSGSAREEYRKAQECLARNEIDQAIARLKRAVEISPQFSAAWNNLGTIAYMSRQYQKAEDYFREALRQDPESYYPLVNLGGALLSGGKIPESLPINTRAVQIRPEDALAHSQLGQSLYLLGQPAEAQKHLARAKALDPSHFSFPQLVLMEIYAAGGNYGAALNELDEFLRLHPDSELAPKIKARGAEIRAAIRKQF